MHQLGYAAIWYLNEGHVPERQTRSAHFSVAPVQTFPSADGWIFVMCLTDKFWNALLGVIGRNDLNADARFSSQAARAGNREALTATLDAEFRKQPTAHWIKVLGGVLPVAPVYDLEQALENPFLRANGMIEPCRTRSAPTCACSPTRSRSTASASRSRCARRRARTTRRSSPRPRP
jgi:crotonobetainyl-CoA:carnitine CoA-transferase CaiB-like acyl-CoA transferase